MLRMCDEHVPPELNKVSCTTSWHVVYVWCVCVFIALAWIIWTCVFIPQMTQKDISFVADFLSEHFSEVWPELRRLPLKLIKRAELVCGYLIAPSLIEWRALRSQGKVLQRRTGRSGKRLCLCCKASVLFVLVFFEENSGLTAGFLFFHVNLQYLKDEDDDLVSPPNTKGNQWLKFLKESKYLKGELSYCEKCLSWV